MKKMNRYKKVKKFMLITMLGISLAALSGSYAAAAEIPEETVLLNESVIEEPIIEGDEEIININSQPMILQYQVFNAEGQMVSQIKKGERVNIEVIFKNAGILTSWVSDDALDVNHLVGDFRGGTGVEVTVISAEDEPLMLKLVFTGEVYSGQGRSFAFSVGYPGMDVPYDQLTIDILESVEFSETESSAIETDTGTPVVEETSGMDAVADNAVDFERSDVGSSGGVSMGTVVDSNTKAPVDGPTPNIIIDHYDYGGGRLAIGKDFNLGFSFINTSTSKKIENIIMSVETSEGLALTSSSSNFFYNQLNAGARQDVYLGMTVLPDTKSGIQAVNVTYKYEYVDNDKRSQVSVTGKIAVPVYLPERFSLTEPMLPTSVQVGEEVNISIPYINKGKGSIANVEAAIDGDIESTLKKQNIGNIDSGKSGTIDFVVIPRQEGEASFKILVEYEDENQEVKNQEFEIKLNVLEEETQMDMSMDMMESQTKESFPKIPIIAGLMIAAVGGGFFIRRQRQKKLKDQGEDFEIWSDDDKKDDHIK